MCCLIAIFLLKAMFLASVKLRSSISKTYLNCDLCSQRQMQEMLIHAFMTSSLDYCNALLGGRSACLINKLQLVQNAAARVLTRTRKYDHISPVLSTLHWLPTKHRIDFKILLITYKALNGRSFSYLAPKLWNNLPNTVREADTLCQFKSRLKPISLTWRTHNTLKHI